MAERDAAAIDVGFEIARFHRDPRRQLRHDAPCEVLELTGPGVAGGENRRPEPLDVALAVERERPNVVGGDDPTGGVKDYDYTEIRELVVTGPGRDP